MTNPAENLCKVNALINELNHLLRDCNKEDKTKIEQVTQKVIEEIQQIQIWSIKS